MSSSIHAELHRLDCQRENKDWYFNSIQNKVNHFYYTNKALNYIKLRDQNLRVRKMYELDANNFTMILFS